MRQKQSCIYRCFIFILKDIIDEDAMLVCNHIDIHYTMKVSVKANYFAVSKRLGQFIILDENVNLTFSFIACMFFI